MGHSIGQWIDQTRARCGDLGHIQRVNLSDIEFGVRQALTRLAADVPRKTDGTFGGDDVTYDFDLTTIGGWTPGWSKVLSVEYPTGDRTPTMLEANRGWIVIDDTLRLLETTPATGETVTVKVTATWPIPGDDPAADLVPDPWFDAVSALAAAETLRSVVGQHARGRNKSVAGEIVVDVDTTGLFALIDRLEKYYANVVPQATTLAGDDQTAASGAGVYFGISDVDVSSGSLFHAGRR